VAVEDRRREHLPGYREPRPDHLAPLVRRQLPQQTITAMESLRGLVEGPPAGG